MFNQTRPPQISSKTTNFYPLKDVLTVSAICWYGLLSISWFILFTSSLLQFQPVSVSIMSKFMNLFYRHSGIGAIALTALWFAGFYFQIVFLTRRLHDLNKTGWLCPLLLVLMIQFFFYSLCPVCQRHTSSQ